MKTLSETFTERFPFSSKLKNKDKVNIKFMSGTIPFGPGFHINPNYWILKSWYKRHGKNNDKINWLNAIHYNVGLNDEAIKQIIETESPDIICFGIYIWNYDLYSRLGRYIKENWPHIIIIAGGPNVYAHKELNLFWQNHAWVDIAIYGDGEAALTNVVDHIIDSDTAPQVVNNVSYVNDTPVIEPFKRFKDDDFNLVSPFIDNIKDVKRAIEETRAVNPNTTIILNWEFTKGCPYRCSFCDWSSGLHHKVSRKEYDWRKDLRLFNTLGVAVRWVDANVGMFKDDIDIIKYGRDLEASNPKFSLTFNNLAKLQKKAVFDIIDYIETVQPGQKLHNLAVQDMNTEVLENIDRPDVPWDEYKNYIISTKNKHPKFVFDIEIIIGLPGQTLQSFSESLKEYISLKPNRVIGHIWVMLINSPSYNLEYRQKFGIKVEPALHIVNFPPHLKTRDDIIKNIDQCEYYAADTVISTNTASMGDIMAMYSMVMLYNNLNQNNKIIDFKILNNVLSNIEYWHNFGKTIATVFENDLRHRNKILFIPELNGKPITFVNYFDNKQNKLSIIKSAYTK